MEISNGFKGIAVFGASYLNKFIAIFYIRSFLRQHLNSEDLNNKPFEGT